mgnify:CR=1 FL=1
MSVGAVRPTLIFLPFTKKSRGNPYLKILEVPNLRLIPFQMHYSNMLRSTHCGKLSKLCRPSFLKTTKFFPHSNYEQWKFFGIIISQRIDTNYDIGFIVHTLDT